MGFGKRANSNARIGNGCSNGMPIPGATARTSIPRVSEQCGGLRLGGTELVRIGDQQRHAGHGPYGGAIRECRDKFYWLRWKASRGVIAFTPVARHEPPFNGGSRMWGWPAKRTSV